MHNILETNIDTDRAVGFRPAEVSLGSNDRTENDTQIMHFRDFVVVPAARQVFKNGRPIRIGSRSFDLLVTLLSHRGKVVAKATIMRLVWPFTTVDESNLRFQIACLRKALQEDRDVVKSISGRGYMIAVELPREFDFSARGAVISDRLAAIAEAQS